MELAATAIFWLVAWVAIGLSGLALSLCGVTWQRNRRMLQLIEGFDKILTGQRDQINEILRLVGIHQRGFEEFDRSISRLKERMGSRGGD